MFRDISKVHRSTILAASVITALSVCFGVSASPPASPHEFKTYASGLFDFTASVRVTQSDPKELAKIGSDFSTTYSLKNMSLLYKAPDKLRMEGKSATRGTALMILNGANRFVDIPRFNIHLVENLDKAPTRRQSLLELGGVISPDTLKFMKGTFVKSETLDGRGTEKFQVHYNGAEAGQYYDLWIDTENHTTVKREWFDSEHHLKATFNYDQVKEVTTGSWLPTRVQVKNAEGIVAAVLNLDNIKANQVLADGLFTIP